MCTRWRRPTSNRTGPSRGNRTVTAPTSLRQQTQSLSSGLQRRKRQKGTSRTDTGTDSGSRAFPHQTASKRTIRPCFRRPQCVNILSYYIEIVQKRVGFRLNRVVHCFHGCIHTASIFMFWLEENQMWVHSVIRRCQLYNGHGHCILV